MYNKYSRRKTIFLARREERNSISRREVTVKNRSVTSRLDFQTVAVIRQSPEWTKVNEARSTPAIIQTPVLLSDRSIWKAENRSRRTNLSSLKTVISRCKRYIRECKTWKTPRAVISIVFRGKTRGWENSRVGTTQIPRRDTSLGMHRFAHNNRAPAVYVQYYLRGILSSVIFSMHLLR